MKYLTGEWLKAASDDLAVIANICNDEILTHMVAFHSQQTIEKCFKAIIEGKEIKLPKIHGLIKLYSLVDEFIGDELDKDLLKSLDALYISSRYPGELGLLPNGKPTLEDAKKFYEFAKDIYEKINDIVNP